MMQKWPSRRPMTQKSPQAQAQKHKAQNLLRSLNGLTPLGRSRLKRRRPAPKVRASKPNLPHLNFKKDNTIRKFVHAFILKDSTRSLPNFLLLTGQAK